LDGKPTDFTDSDRSRRNAIINLLVEWGLIELTPESQERLSVEVAAPMNQIKIISHKEKSEWELVVKYNIGKKRKVVTNVEVDF
jgi:hypothetical protein